jgi:hypothetical protein
MRLAYCAQSRVTLVDPVNRNIIQAEYLGDLLPSRASAAIQQKRKRIRQRTRGCKHVLLRRTLVSRLEESNRKLIVCRDYWTIQFLSGFTLIRCFRHGVLGRVR